MKGTLLKVVTLFVLVLASTMFTTSTAAQDGKSQIQRGFGLAPVHLKMEGLNPALVGFGSYIVNAQGGCNDCHTNPPYAEGGDRSPARPRRSTRLVTLAAERSPFRLPSSHGISRRVHRTAGPRA